MKFDLWVTVVAALVSIVAGAGGMVVALRNQIFQSGRKSAVDDAALSQVPDHGKRLLSLEQGAALNSERTLAMLNEIKTTTANIQQQFSDHSTRTERRFDRVESEISATRKELGDSIDGLATQVATHDVRIRQLEQQAQRRRSVDGTEDRYPEVRG